MMMMMAVERKEREGRRTAHLFRRRRLRLFLCGKAAIHFPRFFLSFSR